MLGKTDAKGTTAYTYDGVNRLKTVEEPDGNVVSYTYTNGNISQKLETLGAVTAKTEYTYDANNRNTGIQVSVQDTQQSQEFSLTKQYNLLYDNNGNQLQEQTTKYVNSVAQPSYVSKSYEYDGFNQMTQSVVTDESGNATTVENAYNGLGLRTVKTVNGNPTYYLHDQDDNLVLEYNAQGEKTARNIYGVGLLSRTCNNEQLYYLYNGHSDVTGMIDASSDTKATYYYDAFGAIEESTGNVDNSTAYAGYLYDAETSLYYLNARMYNPETARFMQEDTYNGSISDPLSLNLYTYCHNEPNMHYDPSGHIAIPASIRDGTASIVDALAWVLKVLESLKSLTKEEFDNGMKKAAEGTERFQESWKDFGDWLNEYKEETAWVLGSAALIAGGIIAMPAHPIIGAGLLGAGISTIAKGVGELSSSGSITGSLGSYARSAAGGFVGGSIMGATGWAVQAAGVTGIAASTAMGLGGIAASMADQHISTGEVDMGQAVLSGALSFGLSEAGRGMSKLASNSSVRNFFQSEQGGTISFPTGGGMNFPAGGKNPYVLGGWNNWRNLVSSETGSLGLNRGGSTNNGAGSNIPKNTYNSIKDAPKYPTGFRAVKNGTNKIAIKNQELLNNLRNIEPGKWQKVYKDGYVDGKKASIHYFESSSGKVFDVEPHFGKWSNRSSGR